MVSREDVEYAYRLFLDREPENSSVVSSHVEASTSLRDLRARFLASPEFQTRLAHAGLKDRSTSKPKPLSWERSHVDLQVSPDELTRMTRHVEAAWEQLGQLEPHWSVITQEKYRAAMIGECVEDFFESGELEAEAMRASAARYGVRIEDCRSCFELGCGVGRVTVWLARLFPHVIACDISLPNLDIARQAVAKNDCQNVEWLKLDALADLDDLKELDAFFSVIVLQHNPPPVIAQILRALMNKLLPNGIGYFQVPTYSRGYNFVAKHYLNNLVHTGDMEMHVLPQNALFPLVEECGCKLLEIREDDRTGSPTIISNAVLIRKGIA